MRSVLLPSSMFFLGMCGSELFAADAAAKFVGEVLPLLEAKCISCHGPEKQEGNLRLDSWAAAKAGGDRGTAIVAGDVEKSLLVQAISFRDPDFQMPPRQKLSDAKIAKGRYVAGPNTTGWAAISVGETAPHEWTVATFDLWQDIGDFALTGIAPT